MKSNLHSIYKTNKDLESQGKWYEISEGTAFLLRRFGGSNEVKVKAALAKHYKPYAPMIANNTINPELETKIWAKVFVDSCLIDWKGVLGENGEEIPFSKEAAINLLIELPALSEELVKFSRDNDNYKEALGNS